MNKLYAGGRLRQLREQRGMTQSELARLLDISASYVNQLEHNGRPMTMSVLIRLSENFGVDAEFFAAQDTARLVADVREVFTDETVGTPLSTSELEQLTSALPGVAKSVVALHRRYREAVENIHTLVAEQGLDPQGAQQPHEQVRDWFYRRRNHVSELDEPAELLATQLKLHPSTMREGLASALYRRHGIRVTTENLGERHHLFEPTKRLLRVSAVLRPGQAAFRLASELALLEVGDTIDRLAADGEFRDDTARRLARIGLANYYAGALVLPYRAFLSAAERHRYDVARLCHEFGVGFETVCHRLSTLQRPRARGVPFSFVRVDRAGNISKRQSATGFHFSRVGGSCPLWTVYEAFGSPGRVLTQIAELPDGKRYFWVARTVSRAAGGHADPGKVFAIGLGCELRHARRLVYSDGLTLGDGASVSPIGMGCKVCERTDCSQRAFPAIGRALSVDEHVSGFIPYRSVESN